MKKKMKAGVMTHCIYFEFPVTEKEGLMGLFEALKVR